MKQFLKRAFHQSKPHLRWLWPWIMRGRSLLRAIPVDKVPVSSKYFGRPKGYYRTTHEYLASPEGRRLRNSCREIYPAETIRYKLPSTLDGEVHWKFRENLVKEMPPSYVFELENARFWGHYGGSIITADDRLLADLSPDVLGVERHRIFTKFKLPKCRRLKGTVAVLSTPEAATNYWHWTFDLLPRLHLLKKAGYTPKRVDYYLINHTGMRYQLETLADLGISSEKIVRTDSSSHWEAEHLVVSSLKPSQMHVTKWACDFLASKVSTESVLNPAPTRIFVSRENADFRRVSNEEQIFELLQKFGFEKVHCERMTVQQQRDLFRSAEFIVAPHGSGLTNLVYCSPGAAVLEIFSHAYVDIAFWTHSCQLGLKHWTYVEEERLTNGAVRTGLRQGDFKINVERLSRSFPKIFEAVSKK